jgi:hypothetical protein
MVPRLNVALNFRDVHKPLANAILLMVILICPAAQAQVACDLAKLVDDSDFIALVQVEAAAQVGSGSVDVHGRTIAAHFKVASLRVQGVLKGSSSTAALVRKTNCHRLAGRTAAMR